ncbi:MAG TPA: hypothetical protein VKW76_06890 [Candidatus Binatia bacterium]|nr:hypothetical protein [Candidatus Binatia bacterium]
MMRIENMTPEQLATATRIADMAIAEMEALRALMGGTKPLAKAAAAADRSFRIAATAPAPSVPAAKPEEPQLSDGALLELMAKVADIIGTEDPEKIVGAILAARTAPTDMHGDFAGAVLMAKVAGGMPALGGPAPTGEAVEFFESRLEPLETQLRHLSKAAGGTPQALVTRTREARSDLEAVKLAKTLKPTRPASAPYVDRRPELRALRDKQKELGNFDGAALTTRQLLLEEARAALCTPLPPSDIIPWGGTPPFTPPAA